MSDHRKIVWVSKSRPVVAGWQDFEMRVPFRWWKPEHWFAKRADNE